MQKSIGNLAVDFCGTMFFMSNYDPFNYDPFNYDPSAIEKKWSSFWKEKGIYKTDLKGAKKPFYNLMMYPYPSAEGLHVGNVYAFTGADVYGRYMRMKGFDVFEPIGFDSGGIHSENYAIKVGVHPKIQIPKNVKNFTRQLKKIGCMYDWDHTVDAMDPVYYRWTQWIFIQLFKEGLAYKKKASVTWCPSCKTTLSDEQTEEKGGLKICERCKTEVEKKELEQWFFRITKYADRLLQNTYKLDWPEKILLAQRNWIGKSEGAEIEFTVHSSQFTVNRDLNLFGSRGEQRMAVLGLKLAELKYIEQQTEQTPLLLLDDIFSELDEKHCLQVVNLVKSRQSIISSVDLNFEGRDLLGKMKIINL